MRMHPTPFPETRQNDPRHQAELFVYRTLARSTAPGLALYGFHPDRNAPESDYLLWLEGVAHFNIEVKGGEYTLENGIWCSASTTFAGSVNYSCRFTPCF